MSPMEGEYDVQTQPTPLWLATQAALHADQLHLSASFNSPDKTDLLASWNKSSGEGLLALLKTTGAAGAVDGNSSVKFAMVGCYDTLRGDALLFDKWDAALSKIDVADLEKDLRLTHTTLEAEVLDKIAWLHSALIGNCSRQFSQEYVQKFLKSLGPCTPLGKLEAVVNVMKSPTFREQAWDTAEAKAIVENVRGTSHAKEVYKCVFAYWLLSFDSATMAKLAGSGAVDKIREFLSADSKGEKIVRLSLKVLQNFVKSGSLDEDIVTSDILEKVKALDYEKWNEAALYDQIHEVSQAIASTVSKVSNFDRYRKELLTKALKPGPLHTPSFWAHPDTHKALDKEVISQLVELVKSEKNEVTLAIACSDLGEIAVQSKILKEMVRGANAKDAVMTKMEDDRKDVRREALLCCQKIMLNKWNEIAQK